MLEIDVGKGRQFPIHVLLADEFNIQFEFNNLSEIKTNLFKLNYELAFSNQGNQLRIQGILGVDIFQFIKDAKIIKCMNGLAWRMPNGIAPFGNVQHFLYNHQISPAEPKISKVLDNYHTVISEDASCLERHLKSIIEPKPTYLDMFSDTFELSTVEKNLEKMLGVDLAASSFEEEFSYYDCGDKGRNYIISLTFWERIVPLLFSWLVKGHFSRDYL